MMPDVNQTNNTVNGDLAGGDITKIYLPETKLSQMTRLIEKFRKESQGDKQFQEQVNKLKHYSGQVLNEDVRGLEAKLKEGGQEGLLEFAKNTKELFAKKLVEYQFSESAQEIHAYLLTIVYSRFHLLVQPQIKNKVPSEQINQIIQKEIIDHINGILEDNVLDLYHDEISGMLYFLTGNCHIKWV